MAYKTAFCQNKGGVGKTNEALNLAVFLIVWHGLRVRLVDLDPQSDLSAALGFEVADEEDADTILEAIERAYVRQRLVEGTASDVIQPCRWDVDWADKLTFIPSRFDLEEANHVVPHRDSYLRVRAAMSGTDDDVDVVIYDCPPSLGALPQMAWADSDDVVLVSQPSYRSYRGLARTYQQLLYSREALNNPDVDFSGLIINGFRHGTKNHEMWQQTIIREYGSGRYEGKYWATMPLRARLSRLDDDLLPVALMPDDSSKDRETKRELETLYKPAVDALHYYALNTVTEVTA